MGATNLTANQDFGIKIARAGYNALTAPDYGLLFNSSWPSLQIAKEFTYNIDNWPSELTHNLGFPPMIIGWATYNNVCYGRIWGSDLGGDNTNIYFDTTAYDVGTTITVRVFNVNISAEAKYPNPSRLAIQGKYDPNYGFKIAKQGKSVNSTHLNDFILHTKGQSPALLNVYTSAANSSNYINTGDGYNFNYKISTSYLPWHNGWISTDNSSWYGMPPTFFTYNNNTLTLEYATKEYLSMVIMRDPLFYSNTIEVSYNG